MEKFKKIVFPFVLVGLLLVVSASTVFANSSDGKDVLPDVSIMVPDEDEDTPIKDRAIQYLEKIFERAEKLVEHVGNDLDRTENIEERITEAIERREALGEDTSDVQAALNDFLEKIPAMEAGYEEAVAIYETHAGFDSNGKVTDLDEATDTLQALKDSLQGTHQSWHEAVSELRDDLQAYADTHPLENED